MDACNRDVIVVQRRVHLHFLSNANEDRNYGVMPPDVACLHSHGAAGLVLHWEIVGLVDFWPAVDLGGSDLDYRRIEDSTREGKPLTNPPPIGASFLAPPRLYVPCVLLRQ